MEQNSKELKNIEKKGSEKRGEEKKTEPGQQREDKKNDREEI